MNSRWLVSVLMSVLVSLVRRLVNVSLMIRNNILSRPYLTKNAEHTWGVCISEYLHDYENWLNVYYYYI